MTSTQSDPTTYKVRPTLPCLELFERWQPLTPGKFNHTMLRIKDPKVSIPFYENVLGMEVSVLPIFFSSAVFCIAYG